MTANNNDVLEHRVTSLEKAFDHTNQALRGIDESLRTLTSLEAHHAQTKSEVTRAFDELRSQETRLRAIETELPQVKLVTKYVITGVVGVLSLAGAAAGKIILGS